MSHHDLTALLNGGSSTTTTLRRQKRSNSWNDLTFGEEHRQAQHRRDVLSVANTSIMSNGSFSQGEGKVDGRGHRRGGGGGGGATQNSSLNKANHGQHGGSYAHTTTTHKFGSLQHRRRVASRPSSGTVGHNSASLTSLLMAPPSSSVIRQQKQHQHHQARSSIVLNKSSNNKQKSKMEYRIQVVFPCVVAVFIIIFVVVAMTQTDDVFTKAVLLEHAGISVSHLMLERMGAGIRGGRPFIPFPISIETDFSAHNKDDERAFDTIPHPIKASSVLEVPKFWSPPSSRSNNMKTITKVLDQGEEMTQQQASLFGSTLDTLTGVDARTIFVGLVNYQNSNCRLVQYTLTCDGEVTPFF
jgi:hypothetical protein